MPDMGQLLYLLLFIIIAVVYVYYVLTNTRGFLLRLPFFLIYSCGPYCSQC